MNVDTASVRRQLLKQIRQILRERRYPAPEENGVFWGRVNLKLPDGDPPAWLSAQPLLPRIYWRDRRDELEVAGAGALEIQAIAMDTAWQDLIAPLEKRLRNLPPGMRYFGGIRFDRNRPADDSWKAFGSAYFILPRFELIREGKERSLSCNFTFTSRTSADELAGSVLEQWELIARKRAKMQPYPSISGEYDIPDQKKWESSVRRALQLITGDTLHKIVLARKKVFHSPTAFDPVWFLRQLQERMNHVYYFLFQLDADHSFLGASPERLFRKSGRILESDALASTRPRGKTVDEDLQYEQDLLTSHKELEEHRWVSHMIETTLAPLCDSLYIPVRESVLKLANVQHIRTLFRGELKQNIGISELLLALHPTPAVAGLPRDRAMGHIAQLEPFDRGWYAGPVGWLGRSSAEFAVGIRSALIRRDRLEIYAGAGIVADSVPANEWSETESKLLNFTRLFQKNEHFIGKS